MHDILRNLFFSLRCPSCNSLEVNYEANDNLQAISFKCSDCDWEILTNYETARKSGFEPTGGHFDTTVTLLNEEGEVTSEFRTKF
ncbi:hypothetical protein [[Scytonema hofmanni] UTEX B 1581]|uniref:hypothetical protein n=1 Tax=[Scytonema hofmanni] UTEX B 1581 TaxID=379535 RepID=UPI0004982F9D|nr:hypothetical protein [[Scytonema hofmanni] UTEX B 1581]